MENLLVSNFFLVVKNNIDLLIWIINQINIIHHSEKSRPAKKNFLLQLLEFTLKNKWTANTHIFVMPETGKQWE